MSTETKQTEGWTRPPGVALPKIWLRENGIVIRDVTPDFDNYVLDHMFENFAKDEPLNRSSRLNEDPDSMEDLGRLWKSMLAQRVSIVALEEGTPGSNLEKVGIANPPKILGANMLSVSVKGEKSDFVWKGQAGKKVIGFVFEFGAAVDIFEMYGVDCYMDAAGLSVSPMARGRGLGLMLLRARLELCRGVNVNVTKTVFTAIQSQKIAAKARFEVLLEKDYEDIKGPDGKVLFANMAPTKVIQLGVRVVI